MLYLEANITRAVRTDAFDSLRDGVARAVGQKSSEHAKTLLGAEDSNKGAYSLLLLLSVPQVRQ